MSATRPADPLRAHLPSGWVFAAGLSVALTAGCLDLAGSLWRGAPAGLRSGVHLLWTVGATAAVVLAAFLIVTLLAGPLLRRIERAAPSRHFQEVLARLLVAAPLLSAELLLALWLWRYRASPWMAALGLTLASGLTIAALSRLRSPRAARRWLACGGVVSGIALAGPWLAAWAAENGAPQGALRRGHAVPRVVLLSIDTLRADALSRERTPHLDRLGGDSVVFRKALSPASWTLPAMASVMTGVSPQVHRALDPGGRVPDGLVTLAEALRRSGYRTAALVSSTVLGPAVNLTQGFDEYWSSPGPWLGRSFGAGLVRLASDRFRPEEAPPPDLADLAADWLDDHRDEDFFLWIHLFDPHAPYGPPRRYLDGRQPPPGGRWRFEGWDEEAIRAGTWVPSLAEREWIRHLYLGEVRYADDFVGRLVAELKRLGLYEETLLVLVSDHGEEFWEHDAYGHGHTLYDELLHVPLLVKLPRSARTGRIVTPVSTASVTPTVLDLCALPFPPGYPAEPSLAPLLAGKAPPPAAPLLSLGLNRFEDRRSVRFGSFKYIRRDMTGREELYDLAWDPKERLDLARSAPRELAEGRRLLARFEAEGRRARGLLRLKTGETAVLDEHTIERLRALGYAR